MRNYPRSARSAATLAAEPTGAYDAGAPGDPATGRLVRVGQLLSNRDREMGLLVRELLTLRADGALHELLDGLSLQVWLEHHGRIRAADARQLLAALDVLAKMPLLVNGLCDRWVSWTQVVAIAKAGRTVPVVDLDEFDRLVAGAMIPLADCEPDALVDRAWAWADTQQPTRLEREEAAAERGEFLTLSPKLFGGSSVYGEFGPVNTAILAETLHAPLDPPPAVPDDLDDTEAVEAAFDTLDEQRRRIAREHGTAMAVRLIELCEADLAGGVGGRGAQRRSSDERSESPSASRTSEARPLLLATVDAEALLDSSRTPGTILHTLAGGRMKVSTGLLQRLVDERGADIRSIVLDDCGQVVGVGRKTYVPPTWLRQATWARDTRVLDPDGSTPIRRADLDHRVPFTNGGATDVSNLDPLGRSWHNRKTARRWRTRRLPDGTVEWRHRRHGWRLKLAPARGGLTDLPDPGPPRLPLEALAGLDPPD